MKKLILHVGMTKTGSSTLQIFLKNNLEFLHKIDADYPLSSDIGFPHFNHYSYVFGDKVPKDLIFEVARASSKQNIIISDENLYGYFLPAAKNFFVRARREVQQVEVIVYLRNQIDWVQSIYQQYKTQWEQRYPGDIESFITFFEKHLDYLAIVRFLESNSDQVHVRSYDYVYENNTLIQDFITAAGFNVDSGDIPLPKVTQNISLSRTAVELLSQINALGGLPHQSYNSLVEWLKRHSIHSAKFGFLSVDSKERVRNMVMKQNDVLMDKYMDSDHAQSFCNSFEKSRSENSFSVSELSKLFRELWVEKH